MPIAASPHDKPKTALVTGGSRRIGAAICKTLASAGVNLAVHHHSSEDEAEALCAELRTFGADAIPLQADLTNPQEARDLFDAGVDALGAIDLLVNNASIFEPDSVTAIDDGLWQRHFAIHVHAPAILSGEMAQQDNETERLIVNMIDQRVLKPNPVFFSYTLSKSALWMASKTMAQALAPHIRVNAIGPGPSLPNERQSQADFDKQVAGLLLERAPDLDEFGETILWLWRTKSVTGQLVTLDGGQHLAWRTPDVDGINE